MSIQKTPHGTWVVRWRDPGGKQRGKTFKRRQAAVEFERTVHVDQQRGDWIDPDQSKITVTELSELWLGSAHDLRPRSLQLYRDSLRRILPAIGHLRIDRVTDDRLDQLLADLADEGLAPSTVHRHYRTLRRMFRFAVQRGRLARSPVDRVSKPRIPREEMRFLTAGQLEHLAAAIDKRYRTLVLVAGWGGPRWGELAGLRVHRVDVERSRVHVVTQLDSHGRTESEPKSLSGRRWVTLPASVMAELAAHIEDKAPDDFVWTMPGGAPLRQSNFLRRFFHPAAVAAGLGEMLPITGKKGKERYEGVTPHDLRHTSVALAIADGAHPKAIQVRMGHASITVTLDLYGHMFKGMDEELGQRLDDTRSKALTERRKLRAV